MCCGDLTLNIQFSVSISLDGTKYTMEVSGFMTAIVLGKRSIDSSSAGVHVSGLKRLPPLRQENQSEHRWVGRMCVSCQGITVQQHYRATEQLRCWRGSRQTV